MNIKNVRVISKVIVLFLAASLTFTVCGCGFFGAQKEAAVYISQQEIEIEVGQSVKLSAVSTVDGEVTWISGSDDVATVDADGTVKAIAEGQSIITARSDTAMASCTVSVKANSIQQPATETLVLWLDGYTLTVGETATLKAVASSGGEITWSSSAPAVVSVVGGKITALSAGASVIKATDGKITAQCTVTVVNAPASGGDGADKDGYTLVWHDEFNGTSLDTSKWAYQTGTQDKYGSTTGPSYWGNDELQYYTGGENLKVSDGVLQITAKKEQRGDRAYTSSRIVTRDKASWTYGYMEARIKSPAIDGMWPAFWMLPQPSSSSNSDNAYGGWAANGEIDIMEAKGRLKNVVDTTIHFGGYWPQNQYLSNSTALSSNTDGWHTYAVDWRAEYIAWIVDGKEVYRVTNDRWWTSASDKASAPFDQPFYILLNLAVGGRYDNYVNPPSDFRQATMYVDYVRVYA